MGVSKVLSVSGLRPGGHLRALLLRLQKHFPEIRHPELFSYVPNYTPRIWILQVLLVKISYTHKITGEMGVSFVKNEENIAPRTLVHQ
jgi:hypothetical protein